MEIKGYIISVMLICVISSAITLISPDGEGGGILKHVRLACGVVMIIVCISPIKAIIEGIGELDMSELAAIPEEDADEYESIFENSYSAAEKESICFGIKEMLYRNFEIDSTECDVSISVEVEGDERRVSRIFITLYGSAIWVDTGAVEEYLYEKFLCEVITAIG